MLTTKIDIDKIREVIGKGGSVIQKIQPSNATAKSDTEEDGSVFVSVGYSDAKRALSVIETIAKDPEVGSIYKGKVTRLKISARLWKSRRAERLVAYQQTDVKRAQGRGCGFGRDRLLVIHRY